MQMSHPRASLPNVLRELAACVALTVAATTATFVTASDVLRVMLEEPVAGETHGGVGNLRGWAVASEGIEKIEIWIDGAYAFDAPYGGSRGDVGGAFPEVSDSDKSGFSLAYAYSNLSPGSHTISAVAHTTAGNTRESAANFSVVKFKDAFISGPDAVDLSGTSCEATGDEVAASNAVIGGDTYDMVLDWRTAEQGFEIVEIAEKNIADDTLGNDTNPDPINNSSFDCEEGLYYSSRPQPTSSDQTHRYYEFGWQADPHICINTYDEGLLDGREQKVASVMSWMKENLPNIIPVNVFYIDQFNASDEAKREHDTDFCRLVRPDDDATECANESADSWGDRSYGGGVYGRYLHNGADLMIYDDAFTQDDSEDEGVRYLTHEYFHTFQTSHLFYFEDKQQFGISISDEEEGKQLPFLPIWLGEGGADFASVAMMSKLDLEVDHYEQAVRFLNQARRSLEGADSSFSLQDFEDENTRINDEFYAYNGGFMAHMYLWHLDEGNFKKLMVDYYVIFAEKYKLSPETAWKDAFEETFEISLEKFYSDFDDFMAGDIESLRAIIKSANEWTNASWD
jgi:hypothetical protein